MLIHNDPATGGNTDDDGVGLSVRKEECLLRNWVSEAGASVAGAEETVALPMT